MPKPILPPELAAELSPATLLVRGGSERSAYEETSEALFMTSGFVYGSAAEAEAAFKQDGSRYVYSRYRNPTVTMFEERLRLIEGAEACRATASGMAAASMAVVLIAGMAAGFTAAGMAIIRTTAGAATPIHRTVTATATRSNA